MASNRASDGGEGLAFSLTVGELRSLVKCAVDERAAGPLLVDKQTLACTLSVSPAHIDKLRKVGLPTVMVGESVRFEPAVVVEWLRLRNTGVGRG